MQDGCTQPTLWESWFISDQNTTGLVYCSEQLPTTTLFKLGYIIPDHASFRSGFGIVCNEVKMLALALKWFPGARCVVHACLSTCQPVYMQPAPV